MSHANPPESRPGTRHSTRSTTQKPCWAGPHIRPHADESKERRPPSPKKKGHAASSLWKRWKLGRGGEKVMCPTEQMSFSLRSASRRYINICVLVNGASDASYWAPRVGR
ncbi:LOW QUALITY PROTEIN: hypothetical protein TorRG33x02_041600 [Trema orientale]|uniref:Uncharacterized protein n=1 Tax=Trema orientale TaxID=63057 RepID=A0A2P5FQG5_TREOI|nr:LOW QUALITY PROTEIN: hypothetical protein TorRG33x02_041600 [Trema orientale]